MPKTVTKIWKNIHTFMIWILVDFRNFLKLIRIQQTLYYPHKCESPIVEKLSVKQNWDLTFRVTYTPGKIQKTVYWFKSSENFIEWLVRSWSTEKNNWWEGGKNFFPHKLPMFDFAAFLYLIFRQIVGASLGQFKIQLIHEKNYYKQD